MSYVTIDNADYETVITSVPCWCNGKCNGTCSGSVSYVMRPRDPTVAAKIKADRVLQRENEILAQAEIIRARRLFA